MSSKASLVSAVTLLSLTIAACSGSQPSPVAPADSSAPSAPTAQASADIAAPPTPTADPAPAAPADPRLAGLTGDDLDWGKKCLDGSGSYCTKFGNTAELVSKQYDKALAWYKLGCEATKSKEPVCCMGLARLMINGQGIAADVPGGLKLWESTCDMDIGRDSCGELARAYDKGVYGVKKNPQKAKAIYGKACDLRDLTACKKAGKKPPA